MPVVSEMVHPRGFDFKTQRKIVLLRKIFKLEWKQIAKQVKNLEGKRPRPRQCADYYKDFNFRLGRRLAKYQNCGCTPYKATKDVVQFLVGRLKKLRRTTPCSSATLQLELARAKGVKMSARHIRRVLGENGYKWLPRRQKRLYTKKQRKARMAFARGVLRMTKAELREKFSMAMDGSVIAVPPSDETERMNFTRRRE